MPYYVWLLDDDEVPETAAPAPAPRRWRPWPTPARTRSCGTHEAAAERCALHLHSECDYAGEFRVAVSDGATVHVFEITAEETIAYHVSAEGADHG